MTYPQLFRRLFGFIAPMRFSVGLAVLLGALTVGSSIALMATSAWLISQAGVSDSVEALGVAVVGVRAFGVSRAVFRYAERLVSHDVTFKLLAAVRVWFYRSIEPLAPARLNQFRSGDLLGRVVSDVESLQEFYIRVIAPILVGVLTVLAMVILFAFFDLVAMVVLLTFMLAAGTALPLVAWWQAHQPGRRLVAQRAEFNAALVDGVQGMADAAAYGQTQRHTQRLHSLNDELEREEKQLARLDGLQVAVGLLLVHLGSIAVLFVAIPRVDAIYLATLTLATVAAFEGITPLAAAATHLGTTLAAGERIFEVVDADKPIQEPSTSATPQDSTLHVYNLHFRYATDGPPVLQDINFGLAAGQRIAVVGPSGAGKSSLANVLLRFYEYDNGKVLLGGHDLREYRQDDVHRHVSLMSQRTHLFNTSIRENIAIARQEATDTEVMEAARQARIHDFVQGLPDGYQTFVGESGAQLSGGERQRIALARVLLKNAPIMILDEATANLDPITERDILRDLYAAASDRTLLVITHRLTMLDRMDEILVLDSGRVVERGTQAELLAQNGMFRQMWESQRQLLLEV